jgi:hypothetical protein
VHSLYLNHWQIGSPSAFSRRCSGRIGLSGRGVGAAMVTVDRNRTVAAMMAGKAEMEVRIFMSRDGGVDGLAWKVDSDGVG